MSYREKPLLKLYKNQNNSFELQSIIDDYESCSFQRNNYEAGQFSIEINYNIPNSQLFQEGLFIQFGNDSRDFGVIKNVRDSVGPDGRGSQIRNITGYDVRYIFKQRIIKDLNFGDSWTYSGSGELCMRNLIKSQCGEDAEQKRRLPVINNIPEFGIGSDYTVSEAYSNLYDVLVTIATQTEVGWYIEFKNGNLILEFTSGVDRSKTVRFDTDFNSLSDGTYEDSSESFANTVYVGGKGSGINKDIYEGEIKIEDEVPSGLDRFECWDNSSTLDNEDDYKNEAVSKLIEYGQTVSLSGTGLAKCPYVYKEEYDVGDIITVAFTGKTAISRIISLTEYWSNGEYDIEFEFGKPIQDLSRQLSILISKIQTYQATAESSKKSNIRYYSIPSELEMPKEDVILDVIGFVGDLGTGQTFNLWFDNENKTGAKTYHVYFKQLQGSGKLTLTTGVPGSSTLEFDPGTYVSIIYVDADGNVSKIIGEGGGGETSKHAPIYQLETINDIDLVIPAKSSSTSIGLNQTKTVDVTSDSEIITLLPGVTMQAKLLIQAIGQCYTNQTNKLNGTGSISVELKFIDSSSPITQIAFDVSSASLSASMPNCSFSLSLPTKNYISDNITLTPLTSFPITIFPSHISQNINKSGSLKTGTLSATIPAQTIHITNIRWC